MVEKHIHYASVATEVLKGLIKIHFVTAGMPDKDRTSFIEAFQDMLQQRLKYDKMQYKPRGKYKKEDK